MQSLSSFRPIPTPTTPGVFMSCSLCRRLTSSAEAMGPPIGSRTIKTPGEGPEGGGRGVVKLLAGLLPPREPLVHRLHRDRDGLPDEYLDVLHRGDDVVLVE